MTFIINICDNNYAIQFKSKVTNVKVTVCETKTYDNIDIKEYFRIDIKPDPNSKYKFFHPSLWNGKFIHILITLSLAMIMHSLPADMALSQKKGN